MNQGHTKVLYLITKGTWGGAQRYVYDLATHLPTSRYEAVVSCGLPGKLVEDLKKANVRTILLPSLDRDIAILSDIKSFLQILRCLRTERPDVVHLNSSKAGGIGALAARLAGVKKIIFTVHGLPEDEIRSSLSRLLIKFATRLTFLLCTDIIAVSRNNFDRIDSPKAHLIYNGIDLTMRFGSGEQIRAAFPKDAKITGTVGELTKNKNQVALIEQARNNPNMYVAIVGEGEDRAMLEQKIKEYGLSDRVKLFGYLPASDVLKGFDTFALPSLKEGLPYILLEARAAGLPITANRVGGVGEILDAKDMSEFSLEQMVKETQALY
ncbi:MAG TPA: glycosyltransferase [Candidatus Paceibacterota bacterium]|nr:glycosyltransferase [Candidatus Paceibacterota bacterium]